MIGGSHREPAWPWAAVLALALTLSACASSAPRSAVTGGRVEVLTPVDGVPVRDAAVWLPGAGGDDEREAATLRTLRGDLAGALGEAGLEVCESEDASGRLDAAGVARLADRCRADGADVALASELIAYGQVRRSWLWLLAGQGLVAGVGHGVAAAGVTGNPAAGWWVGLGEFALETVTWVGGALLASRVVDPVVVRLTAVDCHTGAELRHWTVESTRPVRSWLQGHHAPPRAERLRSVTSGSFRKVAGKVARTAAGATGGGDGHHGG